MSSNPNSSTTPGRTRLPDRPLWEREYDALDAVIDAAAEAALAGAITWQQVERIVANLPDPERDSCLACGGQLQSVDPRAGAWRCAACGIVHFEEPESNWPNRAQAEEIERQARESWRLVEQRIAESDQERAS